MLALGHCPAVGDLWTLTVALGAELMVPSDRKSRPGPGSAKQPQTITPLCLAVAIFSRHARS